MRLIVPMLVAVPLLTSATIARAQGEEPGPAASDVERARERARAGVEAFGAGEHAAALAALEEAYALVPSDSVRFNVGMCLEQLERFDEAEAIYAAIVESAAFSPEQRAHVSERLEAVRAHTRAPAPGPATEEPLPAERAAHATQAGPSPPTDPPRRRRFSPGFLTWVGVATAAIGGGGIVGFGLRSNALLDEYRAAASQPIADEGRTYTTLANVAIGVVVLGAVLVVIDLLLVKDD